MPADPRMRASDADRERTAAVLREHHAVGRLTPQEFDDRLNRVFEAKTMGELDVLLADLPAIDLYELPAAGIGPRSAGVMRPKRAGGPVGRRDDGGLLPRQAVTWVAASSLLLALWLGVGIVAGGAAWAPWFLLIVIPWALVIARSSRGRQ